MKPIGPFSLMFNSNHGVVLHLLIWIPGSIWFRDFRKGYFPTKKEIWANLPMAPMICGSLPITKQHNPHTSSTTYVYIYIYITCMYIYICICMYIICMYMYIHIYIHICMCIYMHVFINKYIDVYVNIYIYIYIYISMCMYNISICICKCYLYTLKVQCWCLPTHFTNVDVYPHICIIMSMIYSSMSMFTLETWGAANLWTFCTAAGSLSWTCFISQTHAISLWITVNTYFSQWILFCFHSTIHICLHKSGCFALDPPNSILEIKTPWERCFNKGQLRNFDAVGTTREKMKTI